MPVYSARVKKLAGIGTYRARPRYTKLPITSGFTPPASNALIRKYNKHFNASNGLYKLSLMDNAKERICYSCKSIFNSPKAIVECVYRGTFNHQVFYCVECGKGIMDAYVQGATSLRVDLDAVVATPNGAKFPTMNAWDLISSYKRVPSCTILPFLYHEIKKLLDPTTGILPRADQLKIVAAPIKIQQAVLKILDETQLDTDLRSKMLLTVLRAFGKRRRAQDIRIPNIPVDVLKQLKTATLIRVLQNSSQSFPKTIVDEIAGKLFPEILRGGERADDAKALVTKLKDNMQDGLPTPISF